MLLFPFRPHIKKFPTYQIQLKDFLTSRFSSIPAGNLITKIVLAVTPMIIQAALSAARNFFTRSHANANFVCEIIKFFKHFSNVSFLRFVSSRLAGNYLQFVLCIIN